MATDLGDVIRLQFNNTNANGQLVNSTTVVLTVTLPDGTTTAPSVTNPPTITGQYVVDYVSTQAGRHVARWVATGSNPGAQSSSFNVLPADPGHIIPMADLKEQLNLSSLSLAAEEELRKYLGSATAAVETATGRTIARRTVTEEHTVAGDALVVSQLPVISLTSAATVDGTTSWTSTQLQVSPSGRVTAKLGEVALLGDVTITYVAGYTTVPDNYILATAIIVQHLWHTQRGSRGSARPGLADDDIATVPGYAYAIPRKAIELLGPPLPGIS